MPERPVECGHCKKPAKVSYKEIISKSITTTEMCSDCPILQERLHGTPSPSKSEGFEGSKAGLFCGHCMTSLESVKTGNPLGCSECYAVFADILVAQLIEANSLPSKLKKSLSFKKAQAIHVGRSAEKPVTMAVSSQLVSLTEALNDAVKKENYEQAAWLRDQINSLKKEKKDNGKGKV